MATIDLKIIADSTQAVQEINKVGDATKTMQRSVQEGEKRQKGLIEDITTELKKLEIARSKSMSVEGIEKYNKKIAEAKQSLKEYETAGVQSNEKVEKSGNSLLKSIGKWALGFATIATAVKVFKTIMESTQGSADLLKREMTGLKFAIDELSRSVVQGNWSDLGKRLAEARRAGMQYADALDAIGDRERQLQLEETDRAVRMADLAKIYRNTALTGVEGYKKREQAAKEYIKEAEAGEKDSIELLQIRLDAELDAARQIMGYSEDITDAKKKEVNQEIINNVRSAKIFEQNKDQLEEYKRLQAELAAARQGTPKMEYFGEVLVETGRIIDENKIGELEKQIASLDTGVGKMSDTYEKWGNITDPVRAKITNAYDAIGRKQAEVANSTIRANTMAELSNSMLAKEEEKTLKEREKNLEEFSKAMADLWDKYTKAQIDSLTGVEQIKAQEAFNIAQIDEEENKLQKLGKINEEGIKMLEALRQFAHQQALKDIKQYNAEQLAAWEDTYKEAGDKLLDNLEFRKDIELQALELSGEATEKKRLEIENKYLEEQRDLYLKAGAMYDPMVANWTQGLIDANKKLIEGSGFNFWEALGVTDEDEQEKIKENISIAIDQVTGMLDEMFAKRVEDAQRRRELLDTQIDDTQNALDAEVELAKLGYANNVDAKRAQLAELEKQRKVALKKEEEALKAQQKMESAYQAMSMISAIAGIFKGSAEFGPIGWIVAIAATAAMLAAFAAAKVQAVKATKMSEGGYGDETGVITGRSHREGGERFLDHVEVERGEMFGVLSRSAAAKHGKEFSQIVTSFNKDNLVIERSDAPNNYINVDVNQTNSRLDKVEYQLIKLNRHFGGKREVHETADVRIEKIGNKTRIIRK